MQMEGEEKGSSVGIVDWQFLFCVPLLEYNMHWDHWDMIRKEWQMEDEEQSLILRVLVMLAYLLPEYIDIDPSLSRETLI